MKKHILLLLTLAVFGAQQTKAQSYFVSSLATPGAATFSAGQDDKGIITLPFHATTRTIEVETNQKKATVSCDADWCTATLNGKTLTLTVTQNDGVDARDAILAVKSKDFHPLVITVRQEARLAFAVISDTHVGNNVGEGPQVKVPQALRHLTARCPLDAMAVVGDLTDGGKAEQYKRFTQMFGSEKNILNPVGNFLFMMGNHDNYDSNGANNYQSGLKSFNQSSPYPFHQYCLIKGYPFITLSDFSGSNNDLNNANNGTNAYPQASQDKLKEMLEQAVKDAPGKPIFVFTHVPPRWTCYSTWPEFENGEAWCMKVLNPILKDYPQVVLFGGHSHYPLGDPRSIHQGANPNSERMNFYTAINTASTTYSEIHPGAVDAGIHPEGYDYVTEGMILIEQPNGDIEIRRYDTYRDVEINPEHRWVLKAPFDGSMFEYADIRDADDNPQGRTLRNGLPAPAFADGATLTIEPSTNDVKISFPQASDDECVFRYNVRILKGTAVVKSTFIFSQFYLTTAMPQQLSTTQTGLAPGTEYTAEVTAYDSYDNRSTALKETFKTSGGSTDVTIPDPVGRWTFDDTSNLMAGTGVATMKGAIHSYGSVTTTDNLSSAGIVPVAGPTDENGAIALPIGTSLLMTSNLGQESLSTYSFLFDIRSEELNGYTPIYQNDLTNTKDGSFFINNGQLGLRTNGLNYNGTLYTGQWHRVLFVVKDCNVTVYLDGMKIGASTSANATHWQMSTGALFFADNDGEEHDIETAEIRFWDVALNDDQAFMLGTPTESGIIPEPEPVPEATGCWTFDNPTDLTTGIGKATLTGAFLEMGALITTDNLSDAGITPVEGPTADNGAVSVPIASGLMMNHNLNTQSLDTYTFMMDIQLPAYPSDSQGYTALFQNDMTDKKDGSFYIQNGKIGLGGGHGLGYNGSIIFGQWHRIVFVLDKGYATAYIDGNKVGQSTGKADQHWILSSGALFFMDDDQEEHLINTAELRFWDKALTATQVLDLGGVEQ